MAKTGDFHIRMDEDLKQAAKQHAADTGRTLAGLIEWLLRQELKKNGIAERQEGREVMKTWYIMDYQNGNRAIFEKSEYEKAQLEEYGLDATAEGYYDEAIAGVIESETEPTWDDLVYDSETRQYYLK